MEQGNSKTISAATNKHLAKKQTQSLNEALCFYSSSVLVDSLALRNPLLRQAPNRDGKRKKTQRIQKRN